MRKLIALAALALVTACSVSQPGQPKKQKSHTASVRMYHFADGTAGYQANNGLWYYWLADSSTNTTTVSGGTVTPKGSTGTTGGSTGSTGSVSTPINTAPVTAPASVRGGFGSSAQTFGAAGGRWAAGPAPKAEALKEAEVTEETINENAEGQPETAAEAEATDQAAATETETTPSTTTEPSETTSESTDSSSSSSDSGGGDSGGGGDGGGGGE